MPYYLGILADVHPDPEYSPPHVLSVAELSEIEFEDRADHRRMQRLVIKLILPPAEPGLLKT